jgi:C4-dicarboxylate transporter DctQ subunit
MKPLKILSQIETALGVLFFIGMFGAICTQIFWRYILRAPLVWPFEFSIYCYIYIIYLGAAISTRKGTHVAFDILHSHMPRTARLISNILTSLFLIIIFALTIQPSLDYIAFVGNIRSTALDIPWGWVLIIYPIGMGLIILHLATHLWQSAMELRGTRQ